MISTSFGELINQTTQLCPRYGLIQDKRRIRETTQAAIDAAMRDYVYSVAISRSKAIPSILPSTVYVMGQVCLVCVGQRNWSAEFQVIAADQFLSRQTVSYVNNVILWLSHRQQSICEDKRRRCHRIGNPHTQFLVRRQLHQMYVRHWLHHNFCQFCL